MQFLSFIIFALIYITVKVDGVKKRFHFSLMSPEKLLFTINQLNELYFPGKTCTVAFQDVPLYSYRKIMDITRYPFNPFYSRTRKTNYISYNLMLDLNRIMTHYFKPSNETDLQFI